MKGNVVGTCYTMLFCSRALASRDMPTRPLAELNVVLPLPLPPMASSTTASQEELKQHKIPVAWRDQCSACVCIPLSIGVA